MPYLLLSNRLRAHDKPRQAKTSTVPPRFAVVVVVSLLLLVVVMIGDERTKSPFLAIADVNSQLTSQPAVS